MIFALLALAAVLIWVLVWGYRGRCKACSAWFTLKLAEKKTLYRTEKRQRIRFTYICGKCGRKQGRERDLPLG